MAMELFVLSDKQLNSVVEWQAAIDGEGYPLRLAGNMPIESLKGFLRNPHWCNAAYDACMTHGILTIFPGGIVGRRGW
jgi:hypothetical protein